MVCPPHFLTSNSSYEFAHADSVKLVNLLGLKFERGSEGVKVGYMTFCSHTLVSHPVTSTYLGPCDWKPLVHFRNHVGHSSKPHGQKGNTDSFNINIWATTLKDPILGALPKVDLEVAGDGDGGYGGSPKWPGGLWAC